MNNSPYQEGYIAGTEGKRAYDCPYEFNDSRNLDWFYGLIEGIEENERRSSEHKAKLKDLKDRLVALVILSSVATIVTAAVILALRVWSVYVLG